MLKKISLFLLVVSAFTSAFAQSTETGNAFNKYSSFESGINPMSGTANLNIPLTSIAAGDASASLNLKYTSNVYGLVQNKNDVYSASPVGLGWSIGFAKIISDNNGSMVLKDDSYSFISAEGLSYNIVRDDSKKVSKRADGDDSNDNNRKWWIEGLPYWDVERLTEVIKIEGNFFEIVLGWKLTDENGRTFVFGDDSYKKANGNVVDEKKYDDGCGFHGATEYELGWPASGHTGEAIGGFAVPYPRAWNLSKTLDLHKNELKYDYVQCLEPLQHGSWISANKYTKEIYLKKIESSMGSSVKFNWEEMGIGEFEHEVIDYVGKSELRGTLENDAFSDPKQSKFLSSLEIYGMDGKSTGAINFCYKAMVPQFSLQSQHDNQKYVKRLLTDIVWLNGYGLEIERESYLYNDDVSKSKVKNYPLGLLKEIHGKDCGVVKYDYILQNLKGGAQHSFTVNVKSPAIGKLSTGIPYLVGLQKDSNGGSVLVYYWVNGGWNASESLKELNLPYKKDGYFVTGGKDWFAYFTGKDQNDGFDVYILRWDGKKWFKDGDRISCSGKTQRVVLADNYIVKTDISRKKETITITIPWTEWGEKYEDESHFIGGNVINNVEVGSMDDGFVSVSASRNHFTLFHLADDWKDGGYGANTGVLRVFSFDYKNESDKKDADLIRIKQTNKVVDLDDDNKYYWGNGFLFGAIENPKWYRTGAGAVAYHWNGIDWNKEMDLHVDGGQLVPRVMASGKNFFAMRHDDNDDLTLFDWNGEYWNLPFKNEDLVNIWLDLVNEAEWEGVSGDDDYFVALRPKSKNFETHDNARVEVFERRNGDGWRRLGAKNPTNSNDKKSVIASNNWFVEKKSGKAFVWNGLEWREESLSGLFENIEFTTAPGLDGPVFVTKKNFNKAGLLGDFFYVEEEFFKGEGVGSKIFYKKDDSFINDYGSFVVSKKTLLDYVEDKVTSYEYFYFNDATELAFDYLNNIPIIDHFRVRLPDGKGLVDKYLCPVDYEKIGLGAGQICREETIVGKNVERSIKYKYDRYNNSSWPGVIYQDKLNHIWTDIKGNVTHVENFYNMDLNGRLSKTLTYSGSRAKNANDNISNENVTSENRIVFAGENDDYEFVKKYNLLTLPNRAYICKPNCTQGQVVDANIIRYKEHGEGNNLPHIRDEWSYKPKDKYLAESSILSHEWNNPEEYKDHWVKKSEITMYNNSLVIEAENGYKQKNTSIYDDDKLSALRALVSNAGADEVLVVPGDKCSFKTMDIKSCKLTQKLTGNAILGKSPSTGRFADYAVDLNTAFSGSIKNAKSRKYRVSAWLQNADDSESFASIKINGVEKIAYPINENELKRWNGGEWSYVEWEGDVPNGKLDVVVEASGNVRMQDLRVVPENAKVSVKYYDYHFVSPIVEVNDRGVANFVKLDSNGVTIESYSENLDGSLYLFSSNQFYNSVCKEGSSGTGRLKSLIVNSKQLDLSNGDSRIINHKLPGLTGELFVTWMTAGENDSLRYKFYAAGTDTAQWHRNCCSSLSGFFGLLDGSNSWILEIDVGPFNSDVYTVYFEKSTVGWIEYGSPLDVGQNPLFVDKNDSTRIAYIGKDGSYVVDFDGSSWAKNKIETEFMESMFSTKRDNSRLFVVPKVCYGDDRSLISDGNAIGYNNKDGIWSKQKSFMNIGVLGTDFSATLDASGNTCVSYKKMTEYYPNTEYRLTVSCNIDDLWEAIGNSVHLKLYDDLANKNSIAKSSSSSSDFYSSSSSFNSYFDGVVSEDDNITKSSLVLGPESALYVVYIGSNLHLSNDVELTEKNDNPQNSKPGKALIVKRLYGPGDAILLMNNPIWAGPSSIEDPKTKLMVPNYLGDVVSWNNEENLQFVNQIKLFGDNNNLYIAVTYHVLSDEKNDANKIALSILKGTYVESIDKNNTHHKKFVFTPYEDISIKKSLFANTVEEERRIITYLEDGDAFDFWVRDGVPYIAFANSQNEDAVSLLKYNEKQSRWLSVGNPAFAMVRKTNKAASVAFGKDGTPVIAYEAPSNVGERSKFNKVIPVKYVEKNGNIRDYDLTISSLTVGAFAHSVESEFRQYILNYSSKVPSNISSVNIQPHLSTPEDVLAVNFYNNGKLVSQKRVSQQGDFVRFLASLVNKEVSSKLDVKIQLEEGNNLIKIDVVGKNGEILTYTITVFREIMEKNFNEGSYYLGNVGVTASTPIARTIVSENKTVYDVKGSDDIKNVCIQLPFELKMSINEKKYSRGSCFDIDFTNKSSETVDVEDVNGNKYELVFVDNRKIIESSNSIIKDFIDVDPDVGNGGSENGGNNDGSGNEEDNDSFGVIPEQYQSLLQSCLISEEKLVLSDRSKINCETIRASYIEVGAGAVVDAKIVTSGDILLRSQSIVKDIYLSGSIYSQDGSVHQSINKNNIDTPVIPISYFVTGTQNFEIDVGKSNLITPGYYKDVHSFAGSEIVFEGGDYYMESLSIEPDSRIVINKPTRLWIQNRIYLADRVNILSTEQAKNLMIYTNSSDNLYLGVSSTLAATIIMPYGTVNLATRSSLEGFVWSKNIHVQTDVTVK